MRVMHWMGVAMAAFAFGGCASVETAPSPEVRQALAPSGKLRVAFLAGPLYATKNPATGELTGVAVDLGNELARRAGVPFQPVVYASPAAIVAGAKRGEWDVALMGINAERAAAMDFSAPYMEVEQGYLVRAGAAIESASDVDKAGIRVGVLEKAGADALLSGTLKNATLVRVTTLGELYAAFDAGKADVIAATKTGFFTEAQKRPGTRILDGRILVEPVGMGVPKGRSSAASQYVGKFAADAKAQGLVKAAIERAGLRGVAVAPPK